MWTLIVGAYEKPNNKKQKLIKVPENQIKESKYVAFRFVEFFINFYGCFQKDILDTKIDANGI